MRVRSSSLVVPGAALGVPALLVLAGCSTTVPVQAAPGAADPVCAAVVLALPDSLGDDVPQLRTDAQATTAWGDPAHPVVLRCGVTPLGPTTERCETVEGDDGTSTDWVVVEEDDGDWRFTTYGRVPAVEVDVPAEFVASASTGFIGSFGPAVSRAAVERSCL